MRKIRINRKFKIIFMVLSILVITGFPYLKEGLGGYFPDLMYHMLRIEGVKSALLEGEYPVQIYKNFFNGYGYGSPLFYPDIFFLIPAILRILSVPPLLTWKLFALLVTIIGTLTTFFSIEYISKDEDCSIAATFMLMLSQFYLADLHMRIGISEYLAFVFIPILIAGIYDFFVYDGKKTYLMGVGLAGLLLSHTITTFIAVVVTIFIFVRMLFVKRENNFLFNEYKMKNLIVTAIGTIAVTAFYLFPMLEQMCFGGEFEFMSPWADVGDYTQEFLSLFRLTGYFSSTAYIGIGVPILLLMIVCVFLKKSRDKWGGAFLLGGILLYLISTDATLWKMLEKTVFNMIQFTYRVYPMALALSVIGITIILTENLNKKKNYKTYLIFGIICTSIVTGWWQNRSCLTTVEETKQITTAYLEENNNYVGTGEWLPEYVSDEVVDLIATKEIVQEENNYIYPLIYYIGYEAWTYSETGDKIKLPVERSVEDLVMVSAEDETSEEIYVEYTGTFIQKVSTLISIITIVWIIVIYMKRYKELKEG